MPWLPTVPSDVQEAPTATGSAGNPTLTIDRASTRARPLACCSADIDVALISVESCGIAVPPAVNVCSNDWLTRLLTPLPAISAPTGTSSMLIVDRVVYEPSLLTTVTAVDIDTTTSNVPGGRGVGDPGAHVGLLADGGRCRQLNRRRQHWSLPTGLGGRAGVRPPTTPIETMATCRCSYAPVRLSTQLCLLPGRLTLVSLPES